MDDEDKTKEQLISELKKQRQENKELRTVKIERKQIEEELKEKEKRFNDIAENALEWIWEVDTNGKYTYASPVVEKILGYKPNEVLKKYFYDLFHPGERNELEKKVFKVFSSRQSFREFINRNVHKNGKTVWLSTSGVPILDKEGNFLGYRGVDTDITKRKNVEESLHGSEERYRAIFELAADSIVLINAETGELVEFNERAHENLGFTRKEFEKLKIPDFEVIENCEEVEEHIKKIVKERADIFETKHKTKSGEIRDIQVSSRAISIRGKNFIQSIWRDITEHKKMEEALQKAHEELEQRVEERTDELVKANEQLKLQIKERKQAEEKLRDSEERYRSFLQKFHGIAFQCYLDYSIIFAHGAVEKSLVMKLKNSPLIN